MSKVINPTRWSLVFVSYVSLFFLGLLDNARGPFYPDIIADLQLSKTQASLFFAVASTVSYLSGRLTATFVARLGLNNTLRIGQLFMGLGFASIAITKDIYTLVLACTVFGFGFGLLNITQNLFIMEGSSIDHRRRLFSGLHAMYAFSSLLSPLLASYFFRMQMSWRQAFLYLGLAVFWALAFSFFSKAQKVNVPEQAEHLPKKVKAEFLLAAVMLSFYVVGELALSTRLALYLRETRGFEPERAAEYVSYFFIAMLAGRLFFALVPLRRLKTSHILIATLVLSALFFALGLFDSPVFLFLTGLVMAPTFAMFLEYLAELFHAQAKAAVTYSLAFSAIFIVSMHLLLGALEEKIGVQYSMWLGPLFLIVSWLLVHRCEKLRKAI